MACTYVFHLPGMEGDVCDKDRWHDSHDPLAHPADCSGKTPTDPGTCMYHRYTEELPSIDITPSMEGFASSAKLFVETILRDVSKRRQSADRELMIEVLKIAGHLVREGRDDLLVQLVKYAQEVRS